jgi:hypothetical protein
MKQCSLERLWRLVSLLEWVHVQWVCPTRSASMRAHAGPADTLTHLRFALVSVMVCSRWPG